MIFIKNPRFKKKKKKKASFLWFDRSSTLIPIVLFSCSLALWLLVVANYRQLLILSVINRWVTKVWTIRLKLQKLNHGLNYKDQNHNFVTALFFMRNDFLWFIQSNVTNNIRCAEEEKKYVEVISKQHSEVYLTIPKVIILYEFHLHIQKN